MAIRGVVATVEFYETDRGPGDSPLYAYQNYFPGTRTIALQTYTYNSFQISDISKARDGSINSVNITFVGTAANVDLVEAATTNRYEVFVSLYRWSDFEGLENPTDFNLLAFHSGNAAGGSADISTVTLNVQYYTNTVSGDIPWRKIPWTILGPLSFRR